MTSTPGLFLQVQITMYTFDIDRVVKSLSAVVRLVQGDQSCFLNCHICSPMLKGRSRFYSLSTTLQAVQISPGIRRFSPQLESIAILMTGNVRIFTAIKNVLKNFS
jgi:hypothetical protein